MVTSIEENSCEINTKNSCCSREKNLIKKDLKSHWDNTYLNSRVDKLGWYEDFPEPSLRLIEKCELDMNARMLHVGVGATTLVNALLTKGFHNIIASDISKKAIDTLQDRLQDKSEEVNWIVDDLLAPKELNKIEPVDLWHDRAVLHFFNEESEQDAYFSLLKKLVRQNGYVIIAVFNLNGAENCSGLPVFRYDDKLLSEKLGSDFSLMESFDFIYTMPSGDKREYLYALFQRN